MKKKNSSCHPQTTNLLCKQLRKSWDQHATKCVWMQQRCIVRLIVGCISPCKWTLVPTPTVIETGATCQQLLQQGPHANSYCNRGNMPTVIATGATCQQLLQQGQHANSYCNRGNMPTVIATGATCQQLLQQGPHANCNCYCNSATCQQL